MAPVSQRFTRNASFGALLRARKRKLKAFSQCKIQSYVVCESFRVFGDDLEEENWLGLCLLGEKSRAGAVAQIEISTAQCPIHQHKSINSPYL